MFLSHRSLIKNKTQTLVIYLAKQRVNRKLKLSYAYRHTLLGIRNVLPPIKMRFSEIMFQDHRAVCLSLSLINTSPFWSSTNYVFQFFIPDHTFQAVSHKVGIHGLHPCMSLKRKAADSIQEGTQKHTTAQLAPSSRR